MQLKSWMLNKILEVAEAVGLLNLIEIFFEEEAFICNMYIIVKFLSLHIPAC